MLSYKNAKGVVAGVVFSGGDGSDPTHLIPFTTKEQRKIYITKGDSEVSKTAAAIEIQRLWRGYYTRVLLSKEWAKSHSNVEVRYPHFYAKWQDVNTKFLIPLEQYAAQIIQCWWKNIRFKSGEVKLISSKPIHQVRKRQKLDVQDAATIIQRSWRRRNDIKIFRFYQELINFRHSGSPALMLKSINPKEAQLLDKAAGAYVRFRLGGIRFPPNIYYKIFTHRPIVDLCAYSPRDYTAMTNRLQPARDRNNKESRAPAIDDQSGWYRRHENNGWRLVSDRFFHTPWQDPITIETSVTKHDFHHSRLQRRKDVKRRNKHRKIEWLWKLYKEGMIRAKEDLAKTRSEMEMIYNHEPEDKDIDDLLGWTNALNFDEYITEWHSTASSGFSDENHIVQPSEDDKYELFVAVDSNNEKPG